MEQFLEYIKMALDNIRANKGRSFLTMLGIIIGITSVVTIAVSYTHLDVYKRQIFPLSGYKTDLPVCIFKIEDLIRRQTDDPLARLKIQNFRFWFFQI